MAFDFNGLLIFEMANNHQGSLDHGIQIIHAMAKIAREFNVRAAMKLQYRDLDTFIHPDYADRDDVKHIPRLMSTRLTSEEFQAMVMETKDNGLVSMVTPFDEVSVKRCLNHGVDILKVASCSCMDWPLLESICQAGKPVICSTGGCRLTDVDKIVSFFEHRNVEDLALLHCVGMYPTPEEDEQLQFMQRMMLRYPGYTIGYSGHEAPDSTRVTAAAVAIGAQIMERHVGLPTDTITLNAYSMNPDQVRTWVAEILAMREIIGQPGADKRVTEGEVASLHSLARGVWAKEDIASGELLAPDSVFFAMPCQEDQTTSSEYLDTMRTASDYKAGEPIMERRAFDPITVLRQVVHEAKGLLREAGIPTGREYEVELSHHYGMENFRRHGAIIVSIVNREYCKKLIILLPGQNHPSHAHTVKEETFQLLYGEMDLVLDGEQRLMKPGDIQLVRREQKHSFSTKTGCIFEEVSTTHVKGDSAYEDERIASLDPVQRKTVIEQF